ncbi:TrgA family protein [Palleronia abyssalis]|uniref:Tellurium resistance protein n=1 Tax=Palleronia abyssalis TaxID=1501240 RepID=A0A2R8C0L6_9RHOB|nr:TrgA family protein [Palleronia abyssalis]SPJ25934.1 hypothetical protein PAA8504_03789 [Palleronia abyssalis]
MPTFAKLLAAFGFAVLAFSISLQFLATSDLAMRTDWLAPGNAIIGALVGWKLTGSKAGGGLASGLGNGLTGGVVLGLVAVFVWAIHQSAVQALRRRLDDPSEAISVLGEKVITVGSYLARPDLLVLLGVGSVVIGILVEFIAGRRR